MIILILSLSVSASHNDKKAAAKKTIKVERESSNPYSLRNNLQNPIDIIQRKSYNFGFCLDSDSGLDYFTAGSATYFPPVTSNCQEEFAEAMEICRMFPIRNCLDLLSDRCRPRTIGDRCIDGNTLREAYCSGNYLSTKEYRCPSGCYISKCISFR